MIALRPASSSGAEVGERRAGHPGLVEQGLDELEDLQPAAGRRDRPLDPAAVHDRADPVAPTGEQAGQGGHEVDQHGPLLAVVLDRPEVDRGAQVEQEPGRDLAVLGVLADVGQVDPGRDVPVDVADVVTRLVLAQVGQVDAVAVEQAAVVALEQPVEPADDLPVEPLEDAFRR